MIAGGPVPLALVAEAVALSCLCPRLTSAAVVVAPIIVEGEADPAICDAVRSGLEDGVRLLGHELMPAEAIAADALVHDPGYLPTSETLARVGREVGAEVVVLARLREKGGGADLTIVVVFDDDRRGKRKSRGVSAATAARGTKSLVSELLGLPPEEAAKIARIDRALHGRYLRGYMGYRSRNPDGTVETFASIHYERAERKASSGKALLAVVGPVILATGAVVSGWMWYLYEDAKREIEVACPGTVTNPDEYLLGSLIAGFLGFAGSSAVFTVGGIRLRSGKRSMELWRPFAGDHEPAEQRSVALHLTPLLGGDGTRGLALGLSF